MEHDPKPGNPVSPANTPPQVARLEALATRVTWPNESAEAMVWRRWGNGPPLVLLHGGGGSWTHWIRNIDVLAERRTVWAPDLPGFGESPAPAGITDADTVCPLVARAARALIGDAPIDWVGFSFGAMVGGFLAATEPSLVARLVLIGAPGLGVPTTPAVLQAWRGTADLAARREIHRGNLASLMISNPAAIDALAIDLQHANAERDRLRGRKLARTDILKTLQPRWRSPVYGIWGGNDVLYRRYTGDLLAALRSCRLSDVALIPGAGHWVQYEQAAEFHRVLADFLARPLAVN